MTVLFYVLGWIVVLFGGTWFGIVLIASLSAAQSGAGNQYAGGGAMLGLILAGSPALGLILAGLVLLAIGAGLDRLDKIVANTAGLRGLHLRLTGTSNWSKRDRETRAREAEEPTL